MLKKIFNLTKNVISPILLITVLTQTHLYPAKIHHGSFTTEDENVIDIYEIKGPILNPTQAILSNTYDIFYKKHTQRNISEQSAEFIKQQLWNMDNKKHCVFVAYMGDKCIGWEYFLRTSKDTLTSYMRCYLEIKYQNYQLFAPFYFMPSICNIIVKCDPKNTGAIKFYERLGFYFCGTYDDPDAQYESLHGLIITKKIFAHMYTKPSFFDTLFPCC